MIINNLFNILIIDGSQMMCVRSKISNNISRILLQHGRIRTNKFFKNSIFLPIFARILQIDLNKQFNTSLSVYTASVHLCSRHISLSVNFKFNSGLVRSTAVRSLVDPRPYNHLWYPRRWTSARLGCIRLHSVDESASTPDDDPWRW